MRRSTGGKRGTYETLDGEKLTYWKKKGRAPKQAKVNMVSPGPMEHLCNAPGCKSWGHWGLGPPLAITQEWWCDFHRPDDYWTRRAA